MLNVVSACLSHLWRSSGHFQRGGEQVNTGAEKMPSPLTGDGTNPRFRQRLLLEDGTQITGEELPLTPLTGAPCVVAILAT